MVDDPQAEIARLQAEVERLRASEAYWRTIVEQAPGFVLRVDREGRVGYINATEPEYSRDDVVGNTIFTHNDPVLNDQARAALERVFATGETASYEGRDVRAGRWYLNNIGPVRRDGEVVEAIQFTREITERKRLQQALEQSEALTKTILDNSPDAIVLLDEHGEVMFINRTDHGYSVDELVGASGFDFVLGEHRERMMAAVRQVVETGEPGDWEFQDARHQRSFLARLARVSLEGRRVVVASCRDVTEDRQREDRLRENEMRLRLMMRQMPTVMWAVDRALRFTWNDGAGLARLNAEPNAWQGVSLFDFFATDDPQFVAIAAHYRALAGESVEYCITWQDNEYQAYVEPLRDAAGQIVGAVGVALDITARRRMEYDLLEARRELERRVAERTAELAAANAQLQADISRREEAERRRRESDERFRIIAETMPIAVLITRLEDGEILYVNRRLCEAIGAPAEELIGRTTLEFYGDPVEREALAAVLRRDEEVHDQEVLARRLDGSTMWLALSICRTRFGGVDVAMAGMLDITARKEAEEQLHRDRRTLVRLIELHDRDRQLIAYEVHDGIVQDMYAALMFAEAAEHAVAEHGVAEHGVAAEAGGENLRKCIQLLRETIDESRRLIAGLRPPVLEEAGLIAALENLVGDVRVDAGLEIDLAYSVQFERLPPALELAVYRLVQEGLTNIWRHSQSPWAGVSLEQRGDRLQISIADRGIGFDPKRVPKRHYGLHGMFERAKLLGGELEIDSRPGAGARIFIDLPVFDVLLERADDAESIDEVD